MPTTRCYSELCKIKSYKERYRYLKIGGKVGDETFGWDRHINQTLYKSKRWLKVRDEIITRDMGNDMGLDGYEIGGRIIVHHMNPITLDDILHERECVFDHENLISTAKLTHDAIHYGDESLLYSDPVERRPNDTCLWKRV